MGVRQRQLTVLNDYDYPDHDRAYRWCDSPSAFNVLMRVRRTRLLTIRGELLAFGSA